MAAAAKSPPLVSMWTPDGPKLVPASHAKSNADVMAALQAMGAATAAAASTAAAAAATRLAPPSTSCATAPPPPPDPASSTLAGVHGVPVAVSTSALLASALAAVDALDVTDKSVVERGGRLGKPVVRSSTQINHVEASGSGRSSVDRGTSNKALEAYKRRAVHDPNKGVRDFELDRGSMGDGAAAAKERLKRDEERIRKGQASYMGENFNAI